MAEGSSFLLPIRQRRRNCSWHSGQVARQKAMLRMVSGVQQPSVFIITLVQGSLCRLFGAQAAASVQPNVRWRGLGLTAIWHSTSRRSFGLLSSPG